MPDLAGELRRRIEAAGDPRRAPDMQAYMKSDLPYAGVTSVPLRAILREVIPAHPLPDRPSWEAAVRGIWAGATYREEWYAALGVARHRLYRDHQDVATLGLYRELIVDGAWWDVVDDLATHLVGDILAAHRDEATPVLRAWAADDDLWLRRTAVICQIGHKHDTDLDLLRHALEQNLEDSPHGRTFWIRKAVGWALRQHARTDPDWVRAFVAEHETGPARLSGLSRREALKHL
jgi:3-methyladenine DNA glycosylase AlkD